MVLATIIDYLSLLRWRRFLFLLLSWLTSGTLWALLASSSSSITLPGLCRFSWSFVIWWFSLNSEIKPSLKYSVGTTKTQTASAYHVYFLTCSHQLAGKAEILSIYLRFLSQSLCHTSLWYSGCLFSILCRIALFSLVTLSNSLCLFSLFRLNNVQQN